MLSCTSAAKVAVFSVAVLMAGPALAEDPIATATFKCADDKSIEATFYADSSISSSAMVGA